MINVEAVIGTEEMVLEDNTKDFLTVGFKRAPTLRYFIPKGKDLVESGRYFNISVIYIPIREIIDHSAQIIITNMVLRWRRIEAEEKGDEE